MFVAAHRSCSTPIVAFLPGHPAAGMPMRSRDWLVRGAGATVWRRPVFGGLRMLTCPDCGVRVSVSRDVLRDVSGEMPGRERAELNFAVFARRVARCSIDGLRS